MLINQKAAKCTSYMEDNCDSTCWWSAKKQLLIHWRVWTVEKPLWMHKWKIAWPHCPLHYPMSPRSSHMYMGEHSVVALLPPTQRYRLENATNVAQEGPSTQLACWLNTWIAVCCMAATCHPRQPGSGHMAWLPRRQFRQDMQVHSRHETWEHLLVVRSKQILTHWQVRQDAKLVEQCLWMQKKLHGHPAHSTIPVQYNMDNFNADGTVPNFAQRRPNTQLACWLKTSPGLRWMAATCHPHEPEKRPRHQLYLRQYWGYILAVRSTSSFRRVDKSERMQNLLGTKLSLWKGLHCPFYYPRSICIHG